MKTLIAVLSFTLLTAFGCASTPTNPQQAVFAAKGGYEVALTVAVAYKNLPTCSATVKLPCSDKAVVAQIQRAQPAARTALDAAEAAVRDPKFGGNVADTAIVSAQAALKAFTAITSTLQVK